MEPELRRRITGALIVASIVTVIAMAAVRLTIELAVLMFINFSAMCPFFVAMLMIYWYRQKRDRFKLVLCVTGFFTFICARTAFHLILDDLYSSARDVVFEIAVGHAVAIAWAAVAAWLLEAGMKRQERKNDLVSASSRRSQPSPPR